MINQILNHFVATEWEHHPPVIDYETKLSYQFRYNKKGAVINCHVSVIFKIYSHIRDGDDTEVNVTSGQLATHVLGKTDIEAEIPRKNT